MLKRISAVVLAAALGSAALVAAPAAHATATAAPTISGITINPSPVVVTSSTKVSVSFKFTTTDVSDASKVTAETQAPNGAKSSLTLSSPDKTQWSATKEFGRGEQPGTWKLLIKAGNGDGTTESSADFKVVQVWETDINRFGASPEPIKAGNVLTLSGKLVVNGPQGWRGYGDQKVWIAFKQAGSHSWKRVGYDYTNWRGEFSVGIKAWRTGWWRAEFDGVAERSHPATSDSDQVDVTKPDPVVVIPDKDSRIIRFNASPEPVKYGKYLSLRGTLQVEQRWDWDGYGDAKITIWFRAKGGSWKYVKTTWTNSSGKFFTKTKATKSGDWKAVFAGERHIDPSSSARDYVKVKR
ncbi:hypothetical protein [Acrocarpospora catenulata]|uniref:hypothetical protein n=1 Tax=Acrocarpospora catenulata TaxID=2836182 RepID=UPI001BDB3D4F|nr:hypothetical protein [Acrocarpospora catenulata]